MTEPTSRLLCLLCSTADRPKRATPGFRTCDRCLERIQEALDEIPALYATLTEDEALLPVVAPGGRRGPGFGSRSPANDHVIALTDPRTTWTAEDRTHNPLVVVESWARMVRQDVGQAPPEGPATMTGECQLLVKRLDFITRQDWVDDFWVELREVRDQLRAFNGDHKALPIGRCPTLVKNGTCNTALFAPLAGETIRCGGCRREWQRREWMHLGQTLGVVSHG